MKERPILFSGEMVRAILDGRKTQTRRMNGLDDVNNYPGRLSGSGGFGTLGYKGLMRSDLYLKPKREFKRNPGLFHWFVGEQDQPKEINPIPVKCPYGAIGDRLWVRETFQLTEPHGSVGDEWIGDTLIELDYIPKEKPENLGYWIYLHYRADEPDMCSWWRPSIFMPRWASRINLEIVSVRIERLKEISNEDAQAEGIVHWWKAGPDMPKDYTLEYSLLWDQINGAGLFQKNPWVWVIEFKRLGAA